MVCLNEPPKDATLEEIKAGIAEFLDGVARANSAMTKGTLKSDVTYIAGGLQDSATMLSAFAKSFL